MYLSKSWEKAIEIANKEMPTRFLYKDEGKTYFVQWDKIKWSDPVLIKVMKYTKKQREFDECLDGCKGSWEGTEQALLDYLLFRTINYGNFEIAKGLVKAGANINHIDYHGKNGKFWWINGTPLDYMNKFYTDSDDYPDEKSMFRFLRKNGAKTKKELKNKE
jgi:hypothetical protein